MPVTGTLIEGKYEILAKIKEGGMGTIYKVRHRLLDEVRVVKVMRPQIGADPELSRRFTQEAKTATRLKHPNIGAILDFALDSDGMAYIVMEYIDGVNLTELLVASGPPGLPLTLEIAHQTLLALGFLHRKNVVHRDVAPDNLMLTRNEDGAPQVKLIDLGIAKPLDKTIDLTSTGVFLGKLKYSSPEQLGGLEEGEALDGRSDLYSFGVVLYELLTGQLPFPGESPRDLFAAHLFKPPIPFSVTDPQGRVPESVRAAVLKAIDKDRRRRFSSAEDFDREIIRLRQDLALAQDPDATHRILAKVRNSREVSGVAVTPSAQDRLDRHFLAQGTPTPGTSRVTTPLPVSTAARSGEWEETVAAPLTETSDRTRPRMPLAVFGVGGAAALIAAALLINRGRSPANEGEAMRPPLPAPTEAANSIPAPTAVAQVPIAPTETAVAPEEPTSPPETHPTEATERLRGAVDDARSAARAARTAAERAKAPEVAAALFDSARGKEKDGQRSLSAGSYETALASFESAAALFRQAEAWSRTAPVRPPERVAAVLPPTRAPAPTEPIKPVPTAAPAVVEPRPAPVRPTDAPKLRSEEEKVRDAVARYVEAQNSLDVGEYARIYPSLTGERRQLVEQAFGNLKSQTLELDIQKVSVTGARAEVVGYERRLAVPRIGSEQRDARERTIRLEKRGDGWVITELR